MSLELLTRPDAVHAAMDEYDTLGGDAFLAKYGYRRARSYFVERSGRLYDSKAIAGVAVGKEHPDRGPLQPTDFSGGDATVRTKFESLGFRVTAGAEETEGDVTATAFDSTAALKLIDAAWGPRLNGPEKPIAVWRTPAGREFALQLDSATPRIWLEVRPDLELVSSYEGSKARPKGVKLDAPRLGEPYSAFSAIVSGADELQRTLAWYQSLPLGGLDELELTAMRAAFLKEMGGFTTFEAPGDAYVREERAYKDDLRELFATEIAPSLGRPLTTEDAAKLTVAWGQVLTRKIGPAQAPQNLISWQGVDRVRKLQGEAATRFGEALHALLSVPGDDQGRLAKFIADAGEVLKQAGATGPLGIARLMGSCALMLQDPHAFLAIRSDLFERALRRLKREPFPDYIDEPGRVRASMDLAFALRELFRDQWAWSPKDLIDVQTFLWVALMYDQPQDAQAESFAELLREALSQFDAVRTTPFGQVPELWSTMDRLKDRLTTFESVKSRPTLRVQWSLGKGVWATVPWIALLDERITDTTRAGYYVVFLINRDLTVVHLALTQGTTTLVEELGQSAGAAQLKAQSDAFRKRVPELAQQGFVLSGDISLGAQGWRGRSYEVGTIAQRPFHVDELPSDAALDEALEAALAAYDRLIEDAGPPADPTPAIGMLADADSTYSIDDALAGLFLERSDFERILSVWHAKKNLVLQGAPGVGKSFVARRLAYALMGHKAADRVEVIQFHQSYGYEDFIQGYRPTEAGGFHLQDGVFYRFCRRAASDLERPYVFIIDEINRGNLSKIFGELMLLIEHDKRGPDWGARLAYSKDGDAAFHVPPNLFLLGMMNTADRSLSLVDYALRRRFGFITLEPGFSSPKFRAHLEAAGTPTEILHAIVDGMASLNAAIADDTTNLGPGFRIGHSFFVPAADQAVDRAWFEQVVATEIRPLLEEYWFDDPAKASDWCERLLGQA